LEQEELLQELMDIGTPEQILVLVLLLLLVVVEVVIDLLILNPEILLVVVSLDKMEVQAEVLVFGMVLVINLTELLQVQEQLIKVIQLEVLEVQHQTMVVL
tara:strand:- start:327 stop:629 length:303 start_codon:yes stop_codon:yes gene_type:complete